MDNIQEFTTLCPEISSGDIITDRKSHFQAHLAIITSIEHVKLDQLFFLLLITFYLKC